MSGTLEGGKKAAAKNLAKDPDFYKKMGVLGGKASGTGGFAWLAKHDPERLAAIGRKGGEAPKKKRIPRD